jgi:hypothetical protein
MTVSSLTLTPLSVNSVASQRSIQLLGSLKAQGEVLQRQMSTGQIADAYSGLGDKRLESLSLRSHIAQLDAWTTVGGDAQLRLQLLDKTLSQLEGNASATKSEISLSQFQLLPDGRTAAQQNAAEKLRQATDLLNLDVNGRYLLSGRTSNVRPVIEADEMLAGSAGKAGLTQLISERRAADMGTDKMGRLVASTPATNTLQLQNEAAGLPFGYVLKAASASSAAFTASGPTGSPAAITLALNSQPNDGDSVSVGLTLPDGSTETITLVARTTPITGLAEKSFTIGGSTAATFANLNTLLTTEIKGLTDTALASASAIATSRDFFAGSTNNPPKRVGGTAPGTTYLADATNSTTIWYKGDDTAPVPRDTAPVRVDGGLPIGTGAQANEAGFREQLAQLAVLASETYTVSSTVAPDRYRALVSRVSNSLSPAPGSAPSVADIHTELGYAGAAIKSALSRHADSRTIVDQALGSIEDADTQSVAVALMDLQTRLQASYQTTALLSKMSLVDYLR